MSLVADSLNFPVSNLNIDSEFSEQTLSSSCNAIQYNFVKNLARKFSKEYAK